MMMKLRVTERGIGLHPNERIVEIQTSEGNQELVIHSKSLENGYIQIGYPVREKLDEYLVELPRETSSGAWRVWVNKREVEETPERQIA